MISIPIPENEPVDFYGIDGNAMKLGDRVFEVIEDPSDGYRSYLGSVEVKSPEGLIFFDQPLDKVILREVSGSSTHNGWSGPFSGYEVVSARDGHRWLLFGTDNYDDYYPCFTFRYSPREPKP